ncbi:MAG: hypothetical protein Q8936_01355 [Bacillota bacterium]|nr:hypothetical protein [Bacillota bacterium]
MNNINMTEKTKLYKILKIKMSDLETEERDVLDEHGNKVLYKRGKKKDDVRREIVSANTIKIITKESIKENKETCVVTRIRNKNIRRYHTLVKENELIRIIRALELEKNNELNDNYIFIKDIINVSVNVNTYLKETKDIVVLRYEHIDVDDNKITNEVKYRRLMAGSGSIRNKKVTFIREELWGKANEILLGGLPKDMEYPQISKFNAYYALPSTDSTAVTTPNIIVIDDFKKEITETFDVVRPKKKMDQSGKKYIIKDEYTCKTEENYIETIKPFDGAGLVDISLAKIWAKELGLYNEEIIRDKEGNETVKKEGYIPSYFQFRAIPGIKGNLYVVDIKQYSIEFKRRTKNQANIKDVFENDIEVLDKEGNLLRNVILTKSQFKFCDKFKELHGKDGFEFWRQEFNKEIHGYKRTFNISKYGIDMKDIRREVLLSYQPLQTLHFDDKQIADLCQPTIDRIKAISTNVDEFLKFRGIVQEHEEHDKRINKQVPPYYKALEENKDLWNDKFIMKKVEDDIKGFKERSYKGGILAKGNYQVAIPDLVALLQYAFGEKVEGCLTANKVYSKYWLKYKIKNDNDEWINKPVDKIDVIRFPHIANEHRVMEVVQPSFEKGCNWFEYIGEGIVFNIRDSTALALGTMDFDGDKVMSVCNEEIIEQAIKEKTNTITYVPETVDSSNEEIHRINNIDEIIKTDVLSMSNDIGTVVNQISKLWSIIPENEEEERQVQEYIKVMSIIGSLTIDFVKTGVKSPIPKTIINFLEKKNIKKPEFMKWKYTKQAKEEKIINRNKKLLDENKVELFGTNECTVNKISWYMQEEVRSIKLEEQKTFDLASYIREKDFNKRALGYTKTLETLLELKKEEDKIGYLQNKDSDDFVELNDSSEQYDIFYQYAKNRLIQIITNKKYKLDKEKMLDYLIYIVTTSEEFKKSDNMNLLWNTWGRELTRRLNNRDLIVRSYNDKAVETLVERGNKLKDKIDKKDEVHIEIFKAANKTVNVYKTEIKSIKKIKGDKARRLALTLLVLDKMCRAYGKQFNIATNKNSIKMYNIYKLADINHKDIHAYIKDLKDNMFINLEEKNGGKALRCSTNIIEETGAVAKGLKDVNNIKKLFKLIA